uniref:DUF7886 domain-containing protein n=1 Tax=Mola mola TaxID=94237 RepID=A0A3Q3WH31_MOLML
SSVTGSEQRRKLQHFLSDLALLGSLQGFKYFQPWLRGKEELLLTVVNEDLVEPPRVSLTNCSAGKCFRHTLLTLSLNWLSPAVSLPQEMNCTLFLLAGYVRYGRPYAWIRSNHERLVNIGGTDSMVKDTPMKLKSITDWQTRGVRVWDVVSELVCLCTIPSPSNPFALDMRYIRNLPLPDRFLATGALLNFLEIFLLSVVEEVKPLRRLHVQCLLELQRHREGPGSTGSPTVHDSSGGE